MSDVIERSNTGLLPITPQQNAFLCSTMIEALEKGYVEEQEVPVDHFIHEGVYCRTCKIPKDMIILGAFIQIPTTVIVSGDCYVTLGNTIGRLKGYQVVKAEAGRRQLFKAIEDTYVSMFFKTETTDVLEAEKEFTPEWKLLTTNRDKL